MALFSIGISLLKARSSDGCADSNAYTNVNWRCFPSGLSNMYVVVNGAEANITPNADLRGPQIKGM